MKDLISIILPVYNAEEYIEKCLESLMYQTYKNIEILCINDGSGDLSLDKINDFAKKDKRIKVFSQENSGPAKTRNVGLKNALGKYIMFCDADDYYEPNMCEIMIKTITEKNTDIVMCDCNIINHIESRKELGYFQIRLNGYHDINANFLNSINYVLWNKIFKKFIIDKFNISFTDGLEHDDANFTIKYILVSKTYYGIEDKLYNYQVVNLNSVMSLFYLTDNDLEKKLDFVYSYNNLLEYSIEQKLDSNMLNSVISYYVDTCLFLGLHISKRNLIKMIKIQKDFFSRINLFDNNWYVILIKTKPVKEILKLYKIKLKPLEYIFSIKNKTEYEKILTIFGFQFSIKNKLN